MRQFDEWVTDGRPLTPAEPIRELVAQLKAAYPDGADQFSWYADNAHYTADPPLDHTPYSSDGWPLPDPYGWVFATDIMTDAVGGVDEAQRIFDHLLASGKDGSAPWLKYVIWRDTVYDVRNQLRPAANPDGYTSHIHVSARTDYQHAGLGDWTINPQEDDMTPQDLLKTPVRSAAHQHTFLEIFNGTYDNGVATRVAATQAAAGIAALTSVVQQLAATISKGGGSVDTAAILAGVDTALDAHRAQADADVRQALADFATGGADAVTDPTPATP